MGSIEIYGTEREWAIRDVNSNVSYKNMTFNVLFTADLNRLNLTLERMETGVLVGTHFYSFNDFEEPILNMRIIIEGYEPDVHFFEGEISANFSYLPERPFEPMEYGPYFITTFYYDSMDRVIQKTLPNGRIVDYIYNNQGLLVSIPGVINNIEYNSMNLITQVKFANGVTTDLTYDSLTKRISNINTPGLQNLDYFFDEKGNIIGMMDHILDERQYFFYDDLDRLLLAGSENYMQSFAFNPLGSILAHRSVDLRTSEEIIFGFEFGNGAGIHAPTRVGNMHLFYDANGNLVEDGNFIFIYNDANRLVQVLKKAEDNRVIAEFAYDETGRRIMKVENGVTTFYISHNFNVVDGEATVYFFANNRRVARDSAEGRFWYLDDLLGSANVIVDSNGEVVERILYYPFGAHRMGGEEKYTFTGKEFDTSIGLYYFEARFYNPMMFVFTQPDPIIPSAFNPQALNRYAYCYNNPIKFVDPTGHKPVMLSYVAAENKGDFRYHTFSFALTDRVNFHLSVVKKDHRIAVYGYHNVGGHAIVNSDWLVRDFNVDRAQVEHQAGDVFGTIDNAALAWALTYYSQSRNEGIEYGSSIFQNNGGYSFSIGGAGEAALATNITAPPNNILRVAEIHSHPRVSGLSDGDWDRVQWYWDRNMQVPLYAVNPDRTIQVAKIDSDGNRIARTVFSRIRY